MNIHEELFAKNFIVLGKSERYFSLLKTKKGRIKIRFGLNHCNDLDKRCLNQIQSNQQNVEDIYIILRKKGAPETCYVVSSNSETNEEEMILRDALSKKQSVADAELLFLVLLVS